MNDAPEGSLLGVLAKRREELVEKELLRLPIPRWSDPEIVVTYRPLSGAKLREAIQKTAQAKAAEAAQVDLDVNSDLLIHSVKDIHLTGAGLDEHWEQFGEESLAQALDVTDPTARKVCQRLFINDLDLFQHSRRLIEWSGQAVDQVDEAFAGE